MVKLSLTVTGSGMVLACAMSQPALSQATSHDILNTVVVCSQIADLSARLACYDGTAMRARAVLDDAGEGSAASVPLAALSAPAASAAPVVQPSARDRFGQSSMPRDAEPARQQREVELSAITARVESSRQLRPGIYTIALDDGTQWQFAEGAPSYFFPPRSGVQVSVERAALGSFRMLMPGKSPVRVRRTR